MTATVERTPMAKARGRPRRSTRDDVTVKIERAVVGKAKMVATHRGKPVAEVLSEMLREPVDRAFAKMLRELEGKSKGGDKP